MSIDVVKLIDEIKKLELMYDRAKSPSMKAVISNSLLPLYDVYELVSYGEIVDDHLAALYDAQIKHFEKPASKYYEDINALKSYHELTSKNILKMFKDTDFKAYNQNEITYFKPEEAIEILYDFFNKYDHHYYKIVKGMIDNNQLSIQEMYENYQGVCFKSSKLGKSYIICDIDNFDVGAIATLAHEFGHAIHNEMVYYKNPKQSIEYAFTNYLEVPSVYFERLFLNYSLENRLSPYDTLFELNGLYNETLDNFTAIRFFTHPDLKPSTLSEGMFIDKNVVTKILGKVIPELPPCKHKTLKFNIRDGFIYGYGMLVATYFVEQYKQDPKEAKRNFSNFINTIGLQEEYELLNTNGLDADEISNPKVLKKELKCHMTNMKKELKINY
ncbi:MAG: M3 family metallopeptidase [Bacilli bacterium]|nr:M3 family metallopeptidase [Bacilli bacterium]MDD4547791.1 M3 family metallopeptidase [Bacilli bacterium]